MQQHGGRAVGHACDVRQPEAVEQMIEAIWADGGALTGLVNNAAGNFVSRTEDLSMRAFDAVANIVMRGSFNLTLECGRRWLAEGRQGQRAVHPHHLGLERLGLHRAFGHGQVGRACHDAVAGRGMGQPGHTLQRHRAGPCSPPKA